MDSGPQQTTAVIRDGDSSQARPSKSELKVDTADPASTTGNTVKTAPKHLDKKSKKDKAVTKRLDGGRSKKVGTKKRRSTSTDESSASSDEDAQDSSGEDSDGSEDTESDQMVLRKRTGKAKKSSKQGLNAQKAKSPKSKAKHNKMVKNGSKRSNNRQAVDQTLDSDLSESNWDSSDSEDEDELAGVISTTKKAKESSLSQDISTQVAREIQRILQLAQTTAPGHLGLGGGLDPGFGLPSLNYPQGRSGLNSYAGLGGRSSLTNRPPLPRDTGLGDQDDDDDDDNPVLGDPRRRASVEKVQAGASAEGKKIKEGFKRVDQVWDNATHNFKLQATAESSSETKYDGFCFHVRRTFDWEGKYKATCVDIKSKALRECLQSVIGNPKGISLVDETPKLDPNILFL